MTRDTQPMADTFDPARRSAIMRRVRSKDTSPEMKVRQAIHAAGFRYRLHRKDLPGNPDLVFPRHRCVLFVHGCFWHWHDCKRARMPATNRDYWTAKIERNVRRDHRIQDELKALGWLVCVIWECRLREGIAQAIIELEQRRATDDRPG